MNAPYYFVLSFLMTAIGAAKCVAYILYTVCVNNYVSFVYFGLNSGHENGRLR
jgi:hypothetical protein